MPDLLALAEFLNTALETNTSPPHEDTLYRHSLRPVGRLGLALEANFDVWAWAQAHDLDAVFLHRPWKIDSQTVPPDIGVLMSHTGLDIHLTLGVNPRLASALGLADWEPFSVKNEHPLGMLGHVSPAPFGVLRVMLEGIFGGLDCAHAGTAGTITTIAVVNAMTDALVREACARGAQAYVTGQERTAAREAAAETRMAVVAVGHVRCEQWGLRALMGLLRERWAGLEVVVRTAGE